MSRKVFYPSPTLPLVRGGSKKFTNDLGLLYHCDWKFAYREAMKILRQLRKKRERQLPTS